MRWSMLVFAALVSLVLPSLAQGGTTRKAKCEEGARKWTVYPFRDPAGQCRDAQPDVFQRDLQLKLRVDLPTVTSGGAPEVGLRREQAQLKLNAIERGLRDGYVDACTRANQDPCSRLDEWQENSKRIMNAYTELQLRLASVNAGEIPLDAFDSQLEAVQVAVQREASFTRELIDQILAKLQEPSKPASGAPCTQPKQFALRGGGPWVDFVVPEGDWVLVIEGTTTSPHADEGIGMRWDDKLACRDPLTGDLYATSENLLVRNAKAGVNCATTEGGVFTIGSRSGGGILDSTYDATALVTRCPLGQLP